MSNVFNAAEIIDMGIEKEKKRRDFYAFVSTKFNQKKMKELFTRLKDWEAEHIKKFTAIRNSVEESEVVENYQGEFESYMKALVDDMLYNQVSAEKFSQHVKSPLEAIRYGMEFEKDAILFFRELLTYMSQTHKEKIEELINEEKMHLVYLAKIEKEYK
ncbi:MAG: ferritin family protein [Candidatus Omnitrophica bacterium]|nr:ferritin family protein [Candidatus Omnitrophota bacterium]